MSDRWTTRWRRLTLLAVGNLVFWVALAVIVAMLVSDRVDLGLETWLRTYQATAIAQWSPGASRSAGVAEQPLPGSETPQPRGTDALARHPTPTPAEVNREDSLSTPSIDIEGAQENPSHPEPGVLSAQSTAWDSESWSRSSLLITNPALEALSVQLGHSTVGRRVEIQYEESVLNQEIVALLKNHSEVPYQLSWIDLEPEGIILTGSSRVWGVPVSIRVQGTLTAERCRPKVEVRAVYIARVLATRFAQEWVTTRILETMDRFPADYLFCLQEVRLEEGRLILAGVRR